LAVKIGPSWVRALDGCGWCLHFADPGLFSHHTPGLVWHPLDLA